MIGNQKKKEKNTVINMPKEGKKKTFSFVYF